jgi:hypothetical protein
MSDNGLESAFNEASLKMKRIHESQNLINSLNINMLMFNQPANKYNYEVICSEYLNLLQEVWGKLSIKEKEEAKRWRKVLVTFNEVMPIYSESYQDGFKGKRKEVIFNKKNWEVLSEIIFNFGDLIREYLESHGMSAPNKQEEAGWD